MHVLAFGENVQTQRGRNSLAIYNLRFGSILIDLVCIQDAFLCCVVQWRGSTQLDFMLSPVSSVDSQASRKVLQSDTSP